MPYEKFSILSWLRGRTDSDADRPSRRFVPVVGPCERRESTSGLAIEVAPVVGPCSGRSNDPSGAVGIPPEIAGGHAVTVDYVSVALDELAAEPNPNAGT